MRLALVAFLLFAALTCGCNDGGTEPARPDSARAIAPPPSAVDPWLLVCEDPAAEEPALLWNGLLGVRLGRDGTGSQSGKSLPFFHIDEYQTEGEEKIVELPNPLQAQFAVGETTLDPTKGEGYKQQLDMHSGVLVTRWVQDVGHAKLDIEVRTVMHPEQRVLADSWTFKSESEVELVGLMPLPAPGVGKELPNADLEVRCEWPPRGTKARLAFMASGSGRGQGTSVDLEGDRVRFRGSLGPSRPATLERLVSFGPSPTRLDLLTHRGMGVRMREGWDEPPRPKGFGEVVTETVRIWSERWKTDVVVDGPAEDQQAIRSFVFYLRSSIHPEGLMSVSPFGLSNTTYNGHVFWDADVWVFPALALIEPERARRITDYRDSMMMAARENARREGRQGLKFPWESSVSGREVAPGESKKEIHITGSVLWSYELARRLGLVPDRESVSNPVAEGAKYYLSRAAKRGDVLELHDVMSPDEFHIGNNDLYTNLLAQWLVNGGTWRRQAADPQPPSFKLPRDEQGFLTYDNDALRAYKQAAAVLAIYPLQYPEAEREAAQMMGRFATKATPNGPAMSDSIHALIWARLGEREKAYEAWRASWQPFTDHPLMLFSEKRARAVTYFTTGAAGCLQTVLYGFMGLRIDEQRPQEAPWVQELDGAWLSARPSLPSAWKSVTFKGMRLNGERWTVTVTGDSVKAEKES